VPENSVPHIAQVLVYIFMGTVGPYFFLVSERIFLRHRFEHNFRFFLLKNNFPHTLQTISAGRRFDFSFHCFVSFLSRNVSRVLWFLNWYLHLSEHVTLVTPILVTNVLRQTTQMPVNGSRLYLRLTIIILPFG